MLQCFPTALCKYTEHLINIDQRSTPFNEQPEQMVPDELQPRRVAIEKSTDSNVSRNKDKEKAMHYLIKIAKSMKQENTLEKFSRDRKEAK